MANPQTKTENHTTFTHQQKLEREREAYLAEEREEESYSLMDQTSRYEQSRFEALTGGSTSSWGLG